MGMQNLLVPHTVLAISLPEGTCSHILCLPALLQRAIPE